MRLEIKASDLYFRYRRNKAHREFPKFSGKPDKHLFDRDDLYEVIPMMSAVMSALQTCDGRILHRLEEMMHFDLPQCVMTREEIFDCLYESMRTLIEEQQAFRNYGQGG
jgi:hypothetical protein